MSINPPVPPVSPSVTQDKSSKSGLDPISQNIETILAFYTREEQKISRSQRRLESISGFVGRPLYLGSILIFVSLWVLANVFARQLGLVEFDPAPFFWLQGMVTLGALLTATVVLIKQNRLAKLEEQRAHLDLQLNLLTEQKTTKLIDLIEELRYDLPNVKNRHDPAAAAFQQPTDPQLVLAELDERRETGERIKDAGEAQKGPEGNDRRP
jgi:uncharacterized membrane protein